MDGVVDVVVFPTFLTAPFTYPYKLTASWAWWRGILEIRGKVDKRELKHKRKELRSILSAYPLRAAAQRVHIFE